MAPETKPLSFDQLFKLGIKCWWPAMRKLWWLSIMILVFQAGVFYLPMQVYPITGASIVELILIIATYLLWCFGALMVKNLYIEQPVSMKNECKTFVKSLFDLVIVLGFCVLLFLLLLGIGYLLSKALYIAEGRHASAFVYVLFVFPGLYALALFVMAPFNLLVLKQTPWRAVQHSAAITSRKWLTAAAPLAMILLVSFINTLVPLIQAKYNISFWLALCINTVVAFLIIPIVLSYWGLTWSELERRWQDYHRRRLASLRSS